MTDPDVVAIDGAAGSGKSTLARRLAIRLGLPYVNTGLMYRWLASEAIRSGVSPDDVEGLLRLTGRSRFRLSQHNTVLFGNGQTFDSVERRDES